MCQVSENKDDVVNSSVGACGGTCKAFQKYGECPRVLKMMRDAQKKMTEAQTVKTEDYSVNGNKPENNLG